MPDNSEHTLQTSVRVTIDSDEWYPVYSLQADPKGSGYYDTEAFEMDNELYDRVAAATIEFDAVQDILRGLVEKHER